MSQLNPDRIVSAAPEGWFYSSDLAHRFGVKALTMVAAMKASGRFESRLNGSGSSLEWRKTAQGIETRSATDAKRRGPKGESPVAKPCAPKEGS